MKSSTTFHVIQKLISTLLFPLLLISTIEAQAPNKMSYQAVIRDASSNLVTNQTVGMQLTILRGISADTVVYIETQTPSTNANGLVSIEVGTGTLVSGDFSIIDWANGPYFLQTKTDPTGGTSYTISGTNELLSVPYALYSETSGSSIPGPQGPQGEPGPKGDMGDPGISPGTQVGNFITWDGTNWVDTRITISNTGGSQSFSNVQPYLGIYHCIALQGVYPSRNTSVDPLLGEIMLVGFNFPPRNWAFCDGQLLSIASNSALFSLLGTTFGGDGRTTFALPDLRSRVAIHPGTGPGLSNYNWGQRGGTETTTLTTLNLPSHTHNIIYQ